MEEAITSATEDYAVGEITSIEYTMNGFDEEFHLTIKLDGALVNVFPDLLIEPGNKVIVGAHTLR